MTEAITMENATTQEEFATAFAARNNPPPEVEDTAEAEEPTNESEETTESPETTTDEENVEDSAESEETSDETSPAKQKTDETKGRISKLLAAKEAADKRAEALEARLAKLERPVQQAPQVQSTKPAPTLEQCNGDFGLFVQKTAEWKAEEIINQREAESNQRKFAEKISKRDEEFSKTHPDYKGEFELAIAEVKAGIRTPWSQEILQVAAESEHGAALQYHLIKNPSEVERINALPVHRRFVELGKLEDQLAAPKQAVKQAPKASKAPAPVQQVSGIAPTGSKGLADIDDQAAWARAFEKKYGRR